MLIKSWAPGWMQHSKTPRARFPDKTPGPTKLRAARSCQPQRDLPRQILPGPPGEPNTPGLLLSRAPRPAAEPPWPDRQPRPAPSRGRYGPASPRACGIWARSAITVMQQPPACPHGTMAGKRCNLRFGPRCGSFGTHAAGFAAVHTKTIAGRWTPRRSRGQARSRAAVLRAPERSLRPYARGRGRASQPCPHRLGRPPHASVADDTVPVPLRRWPTAAWPLRTPAAPGRPSGVSNTGPAARWRHS